MQIDLGAIAVQAVQCCIDDIKNKCGPVTCTNSICEWTWTPASDCTTSSCQYYWDVATKSWGFTNIGYNSCVAPCVCPAPPASPSNPDLPTSSPVFSCAPPANVCTNSCQYYWDVLTKTWTFRNIGYNNCVLPCICPASPVAPTNQNLPASSAVLPCGIFNNCASLTCRYYWDVSTQSWSFTNGATNNCQMCVCPPPPAAPIPNVPQYSQEFLCTGAGTAAGCGECGYVSISYGTDVYEWSLFEKTCTGPCDCVKPPSIPPTAGLRTTIPCTILGTGITTGVTASANLVTTPKPITGSWSLTKSCPAYSCCVCSQKKEPPEPLYPKIKQTYTYSCTYDCACTSCSYIWIPPTTTDCTNTRGCRLFWDAAIKQYIFDGLSTFDSCNSECPCSLWETERSPLESSSLFDGDCTPTTTEGSWRINSTCASPCQCDLAMPTAPPEDQKKSQKIYGSCRECDCTPCSCEYRWDPAPTPPPSPCLGTSCIFWYGPLINISPPLYTWQEALKCPAGCECPETISTIPKDKGDILQYACRSLVAFSEEKSTSLNATSGGSWTQIRSCSGGCYCPPAPESGPPDPTQTSYKTYNCGACEDVSCGYTWNPAGSGCAGSYCNVVCANGAVVSSDCPSGCECTYQSTGDNAAAYCKNNPNGKIINGLCKSTAQGFWSVAKSCGEGCQCSESIPVLSPADPTVGVSYYYPCEGTPAPDPCASTECTYTWEPELFSDPPSGSWILTDPCGAGCECSADPPDFTPDDPSVSTSVSSACQSTTPDPCASTRCTFTWDPDTYSWGATELCSEGCECTAQAPIGSPDDPSVSSSVSSPCKSIPPDPCKTSRCVFAWDPDTKSWSLTDPCGTGCVCSVEAPKYVPEDPSASVSSACKSTTPDPCATSKCVFTWYPDTKSWILTDPCGTGCVCTNAAPVTYPPDQSVGSSVSYACKSDKPPSDPCASSSCVFNWIPDPFSDPPNGSWTGAVNCGFGCVCSIDAPTFTPPDPSAEFSFAYPCESTTPVPDPCASTECTYTWIPDTFSDPPSGSWVLVNPCGKGCICSAEVPSYTPTDPSISISESSKCKSTTSTTTAYPPNACPEPTNPCVWKCTPPENGIGPPKWVYLGGNCLPGFMCSEPPTPCQLGNENSYGCGDCIAGAGCPGGCSFNCFGGNVIDFEPCAGKGCSCFDTTGRTPEEFCTRFGQGTPFGTMCVKV